MSVAPRRDEGFLRDRHVVIDVHVVLIVEPHTFTDPAVLADMELPGEADTGPGAEDNPVRNLGTERLQHGSAKARTDLPGVRHE
jgi:hypothetical protein